MSHLLCGPISSSQDGSVSDDRIGSESGDAGPSSDGLKEGGLEPPEGPTVEFEGKLGIPSIVAPDRLTLEDATVASVLFCVGADEGIDGTENIDISGEWQV